VIPERARIRPVWLVRCRRCLRRNRDLFAAPVVAVLDHGHPHWTLTPTLNWEPGGLGDKGIYSLGTTERAGRAVELSCPRCGSCGSWKARTLADRLIGTDGRGLLVPDLPPATPMRPQPPQPHLSS
jgi:hypothetical protein